MDDLLIQRNRINITDLKLSRQEAVRLSANMLLDGGLVKEAYIDNLIKNIEENGPYINMGRGIAIAHSNDFSNVIGDGLSLLKLNNPVKITDKEDETPIVNLFTLAACDSESHLDRLAKLARILSNDKILEELNDATSKEHIFEILNESEKKSVRFGTICGESLVSSFMIKENISNILNYRQVRDKVNIFIYDLNEYKNQDVDEWFIPRELEKRVNLENPVVLDSVIDMKELEEKLRPIGEKYKLI